MANAQKITQLMTSAANAFPAYDKGKLPPAMHFYIKALSEFAPDVIESALERIITSSKWFPSVSEVVDASRHVAAEALPNQRAAVYHGDLLRERAFELEDKRASGQFIAAEWELLASAFERIGRKEGANRLREKAGLPFVFEPYEVEA